MQDYTIKTVANKVKPWTSKYGEFKTYLIQLEGNGEPVQLNKKADSEAPKVGDVIYGSIEDTDFGQRFKAAKKPSNAGYQRDDAAIRAQWAIGQAREYIQHILGEDAKFTQIFDTAKIFYGMVDRVKNSEPSQKPKEPEAAKKPQARDWESLGQEDEAIETVRNMYNEEG